MAVITAVVGLVSCEALEPSNSDIAGMKAIARQDTVSLTSTVGPTRSGRGMSEGSWWESDAETLPFHK